MHPTPSAVSSTMFNADLHFATEGANACAELSCCPVLPCMLAVKKIPKVFSLLFSCLAWQTQNVQSVSIHALQKRQGAQWGRERGGGGRKGTGILCTPIDHHTWGVKFWNHSDSSVLSICNDVGHILLVIDVSCRECTVC